MRTPNSFVRVATPYETTLYNPTADSASASSEKMPKSLATSFCCEYSGMFVIQPLRSRTRITCCSRSTRTSSARMSRSIDSGGTRVRTSSCVNIRILSV